MSLPPTAFVICDPFSEELRLQVTPLLLGTRRQVRSARPECGMSERLEVAARMGLGPIPVRACWPFGWQRQKR